MEALRRMRVGGQRKGNASKGRKRRAENEKVVRRRKGELKKIERKEKKRTGRRRFEEIAAREASELEVKLEAGSRCSETGGSRMVRLTEACIFIFIFTCIFIFICICI